MFQEKKYTVEVLKHDGTTKKTFKDYNMACGVAKSEASKNDVVSVFLDHFLETKTRFGTRVTKIKSEILK